MKVEGSVLISGAFGNVGRAVAEALAGSAPLGLLGRNVPADDPLLALPNVQAEAVDVRDPAALTAAIDRVSAKLGPVSGLVHTVGGYRAGFSLLEQTPELERELMELNYHSALTMVRAALPSLLAFGRGRIVLFASADALRASAKASAYAASKAALVRAAEALAAELPPQIGVAVVAPSTLDTPQNRAALGPAAYPSLVSLRDVADTVTYLLSAGSRALRFAVLPLGS